MKYQQLLNVLGTVIVLTSLYACNAGSGDGLNEQGQPVVVEIPSPEPDTTEPSPDPIPEPIPDPVEEGIQPTLASIQAEVFTPICSVCHGAANPAAGQNLSTVFQP